MTHSVVIIIRVFNYHIVSRISRPAYKPTPALGRTIKVKKNYIHGKGGFLILKLKILKNYLNAFDVTLTFLICYMLIHLQ